MMINPRCAVQATLAHQRRSRRRNAIAADGQEGMAAALVWCASAPPRAANGKRHQSLNLTAERGGLHKQFDGAQDLSQRAAESDIGTEEQRTAHFTFSDRKSESEVEQVVRGGLAQVRSRAERRLRTASVWLGESVCV